MRKRNSNLRLTALTAAMAGVGAMISLPAFAAKVVDEGDLSVTVDTTLSAGTAWRASDPNSQNIGPKNGGSHLHSTSEQDNSDLRWKKGLPYSQVLKATTDVQVEYKDYGAFVRGKAFYDDAIMKGDGGTDLPANFPKTDAGNPAEPDQHNGRNAEILDAFVWTNYQINDRPMNVRLGQQVINWGEGVLFPHGINTVNPINVNALLTPGAELKEALIPVKMLYSSLGITDTLSAEAFYQFEWRKTAVPDCGTFFNIIDIVGDHCNSGYFTSGLEPGLTFAGRPAEDFRLGGTNDISPKNGGEYGVAVRYFVDAIQAEVGAYYINYHSRLPIISGYAPNADAFAETNALNAISKRLTTAAYALEYPEDIHLYGLSFNTNLDLGLPGGQTAVSGELSYRPNQPYQVEDSVLLTGLIGAPSQICSEAVDASCLNIYQPGQFISGGIRNDFYQGELAFIHFFDRALGADRWTVILDLAYDYANIPSNDVLLMNAAYNADIRPEWSSLVNPANSASITDPTSRTINNLLFAQGKSESEYYPTQASWGYKLRMSGEYSNVFAGVNLVPTISYSQDVRGVTPGPASNFMEGRKSLGVSLEANYLNAYKAEIGYTDFYGAEPYNQLNDRDYYYVSTSVSF